MQNRQDQTVAVVAPGDMGHAVGAVLRSHGLRVITNLQGRGARTRDVAAAAEIEDVGSDRALLDEADMLLSILVPARAVDFAAWIAAVANAGRADLLFVDCNALAPQTTLRIGEIVMAAGLAFVDGGIIGPPPRPGRDDMRLYVSGPQASEVGQLRDHGLDIRVVSDRVGDASAVKMCYAALNKGLIALATQLTVAAKSLGVEEALWAEFADSQSALVPRMRQQIPRMVPKAYRWVGEMEEIAKTFEACGLSSKMFLGAADTYDQVTETVGPDPDKIDFEPLIELLAAASAKRRG